MKNILTNLRLPAIISLLIVLPFMLLEYIFLVVNRLHSFSMRNALDMVVVFGFLWLGIAAIILILLPFVRNIPARNKIRANPTPPQGNAIPNIFTNPKAAVIIGCTLALPFMTILTLLMFGIEPSFGPLKPLLNNPDPDQPDVLGSLIVLSAFLLAILACIIVRAPIVRTVRAGGSLFAHPINLVLAVTILILVTAVVGGIILDQYPCWIGVPNCD